MGGGGDTRREDMTGRGDMRDDSTRLDPTQVNRRTQL